MTDKEIQQRCKDEWDMQVEIFRSCYSKGYNDAKREIAMSGEYERVYQRGRDSVIAVIEENFLNSAYYCCFYNHYFKIKMNILPSFQISQHH